ncbi:DUF1330 domain-containing protein [Deefgea sp. CFH1-16]|uniref:DUF1330 domain-containing protein n=1 Tax=Deefgea sp. CFH1-16 TaxID=2675457 RepID=UPI0015F6526F|nr:DUF1330 domain-containing protein [Deefgea sp. CFH1-16]MBM5573266.1 DUF1330 domain-containing protein [Deefgea sp. CFH1-16]
MAKGYWIVRLDITHIESFQAYIAANGAALAQYGAMYLTQAGKFIVPEGNTRSRNTIVEFPSYQAALDCWHCAPYQAAKALREGSCEIDLVIVEGCEIAVPKPVDFI